MTRRGMNGVGIMYVFILSDPGTAVDERASEHPGDIPPFPSSLFLSPVGCRLGYSGDGEERSMERCE